MLKRGIQVLDSTNCIAGVPSLKPSYSGSVTRKLTAAPISATQRTSRACRSLPNASSTTPKKIGTQIARLSNPIFLVSLSEPNEVGHQDEHADDHRQRIVVQVTGLHPAQRAGHGSHHFPRAVDDQRSEEHTSE